MFSHGFKKLNTTSKEVTGLIGYYEDLSSIDHRYQGVLDCLLMVKSNFIQAQKILWEKIFSDNSKSTNKLEGVD